MRFRLGSIMTGFPWQNMPSKAGSPGVASDYERLVTDKMFLWEKVEHFFWARLKLGKDGQSW